MGHLKASINLLHNTFCDNSVTCASRDIYVFCNFKTLLTREVRTNFCALCRAKFKSHIGCTFLVDHLRAKHPTQVTFTGPYKSMLCVCACVKKIKQTKKKIWKTQILKNSFMLLCFDFDNSMTEKVQVSRGQKIPNK